MFKVICIDASNQSYDGTPNVVEGNIYTVVGETVTEQSYILSELSRGVVSSGNIGGFKKSRFIPLSQIDETELLQQREVLITV